MRRTTTLFDTIMSKIGGAVGMLAGLDYHYSNFMCHFGRLACYYERGAAFLKHAMERRSGEPLSPIATAAESRTLDALQHEAIAYINRLGQFYSFA